MRDYVLGLVAGLERKNGWTLAERAGAISPDGMQRLLRTADWDIDAVRDAVRGYVVNALGSPDAVLILDDTGFLKKGRRSAGVTRQYSGTAGRIENCQIGVFLAYATAEGHALIDRELYLPEAWTNDRERCTAAGIGEEVAFATKPQLAQVLLARAFTAGVPFAWVTADEAYGQVKYLRGWLEDRDVPYVLATRRNDALTTVDGRSATAEELLAGLSARSWGRLSVGAGAHGPREYDWARVPLGPDSTAREGTRTMIAGRGRWLLARRSRRDPTEIAYYVCFAHRRTTLLQLAWIAGTRWRIEECFQQAKNEAGLDHYQVRAFRAWYAHITLSMLAYAWLTVTRRGLAAAEAAGEPLDDQLKGATTHRPQTESR